MSLMGLKPDRSVTAALVGLTVLWLGFSFGGEAVKNFYVQHLLVTPRRAIGVEPWQLLTGGFIHLRLGELFMTAVMLIFFGNPIEQQMGERAFWRIFIGGGVVGAIAAALLGRLILPGQPVPLSSAATTALLLAFGAAWRGQSVMAYGMAQMRATTMALVFFAITVVSCLVRLDDLPWQIVVIELAALVGAAGAGWVLASPRAGGSKGGGLSFEKFRTWRLKRKYRVLTGGRDSRDDKRWLN
ncbi:MAG: rhomboid family intrarane serine protease [Myxococcales bacterium]|nr:rhomboid family intrarane serine protease [Myxococcales bacterium]